MQNYLRVIIIKFNYSVFDVAIIMKKYFVVKVSISSD